MAHTQNTDAVHPPTKAADDAVHQVQSQATAATATSFDWGAAISAIWRGKVWVTVEAFGFPVYVRFGPTSTTATTTSNGRVIPVGTKERFLVDTIKHRYIDVISTDVGVIKVQVDSYGLWDRRDQ